MSQLPPSGSGIDPGVIGSGAPPGPTQIPEVTAPHKEKIDWFRNEFRPHYERWITLPLFRLIQCDNALVAFIFMSCAIDYLGSFLLGESTKGKVKSAYTEFIRRYFPSGLYDPDDLYDSLRNGLVHLFTIKDRKYALIDGNSHLHLTKDVDGQVWLNAEDFMQDLNTARERYFDDVETNRNLMDKLLKRLERDGFLGTVPLQLP